MPKAFDNCAKSGGRIITIKPNLETHIRICFKENKSFRGKVKKTKSRIGNIVKAVSKMRK